MGSRAGFFRFGPGGSNVMLLWARSFDRDLRWHRPLDNRYRKLFKRRSEESNEIFGAVSKGRNDAVVSNTTSAGRRPPTERLPGNRACPDVGTGGSSLSTGTRSKRNNPASSPFSEYSSKRALFRVTNSRHPAYLRTIYRNRKDHTMVDVLVKS